MASERPLSRGRTQRHAVGAKVRVFFRNPDELANERAELARLLNKAGICFLHEMSLSTASGWPLKFCVLARCGNLLCFANAA
jgi:hypothetical protein